MAAQGAELKLRVSLDLTSLRRQLSTIGTELSGQGIYVPIKFDRKTIANEFRLLDRYVGRKEFNVKINSNLSAELDKVRKLSDAIKSLPKGGGPTGAIGTVQAGFTQSKLRSLGEDIKPLYRAAADAGLIAFNQAIANNRKKIAQALSEVGQDSIAGLLNGLSSGDAKVREAAVSLGAILITTIKTGLGIASPSKETGKLGKFAAEGFVLGFINGAVAGERKLAASTQQMFRAIAQATKEGNQLIIGALYEVFERTPELSAALKPFGDSLTKAITSTAKKAFRDGLKGAMLPGIKGGLLGAAGGGLFGAGTGAVHMLGGAAQELSQRPAASVAKSMGRLFVGNTSELTSYVQDFTADIIHQAFSTGSLGALLGAAGVAGVAGTYGFVKGSSGSLMRQIYEAIINKIASDIETTIHSYTSGNFGPSIGKALQGFTQALIADLNKNQMKMAFPPMLPALPPAYRGISGTPERTALPPAYRGLPAQREQLALPPAYRGLPKAGFDFNALAGMPSPANPPGKLISLESGFIADMRKRFARVAERYLFGIETQVVDLFDSAEAAVRVQVDRMIAQIQGEISAKARRGISVRDLGNVPRLMLPGTAPGAPRPALPSAGQTSTGQARFNAVTTGGRGGGGGGYVPPSGFPSEGPMGGKQGPASYIGAGGHMEKFKTALAVAGRSMDDFRASSIPFIGGLKQIGVEFAMATKQVLLYGTAYRGLAFITNLPGQILNAAKGQQQYNNALQTATQDTNTFAKELLYVDNVQRAFGLNLETTRTGFTRLFASMAPSGFDSGSIEKLFTGISAATAALQLTPDKAERVIYAFGQMASKGQIMSEELKGQLGDVLPGALALFAKAAGMSVKDFSKAMEDGVFIGGKFREVFAKVSDELMVRFSTGAQAAGKSLQGLLNTVQGDFQRTLESFSPLANAAAQSILGPVGGALRQLSVSAQIATGELERIQGQLSAARQNVKDVRAGGGSASQIQGAEQQVAALEVRYRALNEALKDPAVAKQVKDLQALVQELIKAGTFALNLGTAIGNVLSPVINLLGTNLSSVVANLTLFVLGFNAAKLAVLLFMGAMTTMNAVQGITARGAAGATIMAGALRALGVATTGAEVATIGFGVAVKGLLISTGIGALVVLLGSLAAGFLSVGDSAAAAANKAKMAMDSMREAVAAGRTEEVQAQLAASRRNRNDIESAVKWMNAQKNAANRQYGKSTNVQVKTSLATRMQLEQAGYDLQGKSEVSIPALEKQTAGLRANARNLEQRAVVSVAQAEQQRQRLGLNKPTPSPMPPEAPTGGTGTSKDAAKEAGKVKEEIARQAAAASDALFAEQQRLLVMQQTNPTAKALVEYANKELVIQRDLNKGLAEAKSQKETDALLSSAAIARQINALELQQGLAEARRQAMQPLEDALRNQREQLLVENDIKNLIANGMNPERAKEVAEVRKMTRAAMETIDAQISAIDNQIKLTKAAILEREAREGSTKAVQKLRDELAALEEEKRKAEGERKGTKDKGAQAEAGVPEVKPKTPGEMITDRIAKLKEEIANLTNVGTIAISIADGIGDAFGQAFQGLITGAMTAQQALASFFKSVGEMFVSMAAQIIAKQMALLAIQLLLKALGLFGGGGGSGGDLAKVNMTDLAKYSAPLGYANGGFIATGFQAFADGGMVNSPTLGLVGEGGQPEYIIPASKMSAAMNRYASGARGAAVIPSAGDSNGGPTAGLPLDASSIDIRYSVERINSVDYVTADQFQRGMAQAAQQGAAQGEQRTLRRLQQSRSTRSRLGMR